MWKKIKRILGIDKKTPRQLAFFEDANAYAGIYMSVVIIVLELFMIGCLVHNVWFGSKERSSEWIIQHLTAYLVLIAMAVVLLIFCIRYRGRRLKHSVNWGRFIRIIFSLVCIAFGMYISYLDYIKGEQILTFLTMILFAVCLLNWRPIVTLFMMTLSFAGFYVMMGVGKEITYATTINFIIYWISIMMVSISIYHQRLSEAEKSERLEQVNEHLKKLAITDELTGIHNMNYFHEQAAVIAADPNRKSGRLIVLYVDIENFKTYNDKYGFEQGNELLKKVSTQLESAFEGELVSRFSDDHFVVLTDDDNIADKINTLSHSIRVKMDEVYLGIKAGGYHLGNGAVDIASACDHARYACSTIKTNYDEHYCEYDKSMDDGVIRKHYIINNIRDAVAKEYIKVYYQPVVWAEDKTVCGVEALARWIDPRYGFLSPGDFIPALEESRQVYILDKGIVEIACRDIRDRMNSGEPILPVSVNFSRVDFESFNVVAYLKEVTAKYEVPPKLIHVEVTESALTMRSEELGEAIKKLNEIGFTVWLDDFGSGYSSLNVLKDYEFSVLKIDMNFLSNFSSNKKSKPILDSVVRMAEQIEMRTLSEGVETEEASEFLKEIGCERLQGYLFGKPMPKEELYEKINSGEITVSEKINAIAEGDIY